MKNSQKQSAEALLKVLQKEVSTDFMLREPETKDDLYSIVTEKDPELKITPSENADRIHVEVSTGGPPPELELDEEQLLEWPAETEGYLSVKELIPALKDYLSGDPESISALSSLFEEQAEKKVETLEEKPVPFTTTKLQVDYRTTIIIQSQKALEMWMSKYPKAKIVT